MELTANPTSKFDVSKALSPVKRPPCGDGQYPRTITEQSGLASWTSGSERRATSEGAAEFLKEQNSIQERFHLVDDSIETDSEEEDSHDVEKVPAASPPPKRKHLRQTVLHGLRGTPAVSCELVEKGPDAPEVWCYEGAGNICRRVEQDMSDRTVTEPQGLPLPTQPTSRRKYNVLRSVAMVLTFMAIVALWGVVDMLVEIPAGVSSFAQFQLYGVIIFVGIVATLALRKLKALTYSGTFYPTLLSSLLTAAGGWGLVDVAVEVAAGRDPILMLLSYFILFVGTGFLVALYMLLVDRGFREVLGRFI